MLPNELYLYLFAQTYERVADFLIQSGLPAAAIMYHQLAEAIYAILRAAGVNV